VAQTLIARLKATEFLPNSWLFEVWVLTSTTHRALRGQPHRSSALDGAAAVLTVARTRGVAMPLSWSCGLISLRATRARLPPRSAVL
jgi:hypothetical protein